MVGITLSKRWEMALLLLSGIAIVYTLRVNISVAAVAMKRDLGWSEMGKGYVLSSFYWGYFAGQIPSSMLTQKYGAKWIFGLSIAISSVLTLLCPVVCRHSLTMALFIRGLIGFFASASFPCVYHFFPIWVPNSEKTFMIPVIFSGIYAGEIVAFSLSGTLVSTTFVYKGVVCGGWPSIFYVFGTLGLLWFPLWIYAAHESPSVHPYILKEELQLITQGKDFCAEPNAHLEAADELASKPLLSPETTTAPGGYAALEGGTAASAGHPGTDPTITHSSGAGAGEHSALIHRGASTKAPNGQNASPRHPRPAPKRYTKEESMARTPWRAMLTHPVALALLWCNFGHGWIGFTLLSEMPSYLTDILGFDLGSAGILCVFPYLALFMSTLAFARLFDYLQREHDWKVDRVRKTAMFVTYMGSALGLALCGYTENKYAAYTFMVLTQVVYGAAQSGISCVWTDVAPVYSAQLNSLGNVLNALAGMLGPIVVAHTLQALPGLPGWRFVFLLTFLLCVSFTTVWFVYIRTEIVPVLNTPTPLESESKQLRVAGI